MTSFFFYFLTGWLLLWGQVALTNALREYGLHMDLILLSVFYFALRGGSLVAEVYGFLLGLCLDASWMGVLGLRSLLYSMVGFFIGLLQRDLDASKLWTQLLGAFLISTTAYIFQGVLLKLLSGAVVAWQPLLAQIALTTLFTPIFFWFLDRWSSWWGLYKEPLV